MEMIPSKDEIFPSSPLKQVVLPIIIHDKWAEDKRAEENLKSIKRMMARLGNRECEAAECHRPVSANKRWCQACHKVVLDNWFATKIKEKTA